MGKVVIYLEAIEADALCKLAEWEFRDTRSQAALIIRQELERRGLLNSKSLQEQLKHEVQNER